MNKTTTSEFNKTIRKLNRMSQKDLTRVFEITLEESKTIEEKESTMHLFSHSKINDKTFKRLIINDSASMLKLLSN
jgi:hypothetical protein|tara:strand:- start:657 stop:884 length:228 start_codon:yes stop_codon:yes gene_type:complete